MGGNKRLLNAVETLEGVWKFERAG